MSDRIRVGIIGASGYAGGELLRLLTTSSRVRVAYLASATHAGKDVLSAFPGASPGVPEFEPFDLKRALESCDVLFLAQGSGEAMKVAEGLLEAGKRVIDLSADFRLKDPATYEQWYGARHESPSLLGQAAYGLPELRREDIRSSALVANPGCYPTAALLGLAPLIRAGWIDLSSVVIDAKSGVSGAGRSRSEPRYLFSELNESVMAYGVGGRHRHLPEIEQELSTLAGRNVQVSFTPHLIPMTRGLLATCYASLTGSADLGDLIELYNDAYSSETFIYVSGPGEQPTTKACLGTNRCHLGIALDERTGRAVITSAIDNLGKGAAGQAVQNMNLMLGLPETHALEGGGLWP
jgi:N-acetyl-gamma-glutamyl-phosphate reductase